MERLIGLIVVISALFRPLPALSKDQLLVIALSTNRTDTDERLIRSLDLYGYRYEVLTDGLRVPDDPNQIVLLIDNPNVIFTQGPEFVLKKFETFKPARIVVSADKFCWPDESLQDAYPLVESNEKRFLNSALMIGYASDLHRLFNSKETIPNLQSFLTKIYLTEERRKEWSIALDKRADIFLNLHGAIDEVELPVQNDEVYVKNIWTDSVPALIHGNGPSKKSLNYLSNYIARTWSTTEGSVQGKENNIDVTQIDDLSAWPMVYLAVFIEYPTPFLREFFEKVHKLTYPKQRLGILFHNQVDYHKKLTEEYLAKFKKDDYAFVKYLNVNDDVTEGEARQQAISECRSDRCDYLFAVDSIVHLDHPDTLIHLIRYNRTVVAPMLLRPGQAWSNFWGDFNEQGYYQRSPDYMDLVNYKKMGLFNVPHVTNAYLINGTFLQRYRPTYIDAQFDPDVKFCQSIRDSGYFMFITNEMNYGHLIDPENFNTSVVQPELYETFNNIKDWKARYLHPDYQQALDANATIAQPCRDVYWFPLMSEEFTESLINLVESDKQWSDSADSDVHLAGVNFQEHWLFVLRDIVQPMQQKVFTGYYSDPPRSTRNVVVRSTPSQLSKDIAIYVLNLALNDVGKDYEGGGARFVRYNCSVTTTRRGWALLQPGQLTHLYEDLPVSKGTQYFLLSLIDP